MSGVGTGCVGMSGVGTGCVGMRGVDTGCIGMRGEGLWPSEAGGRMQRRWLNRLWPPSAPAMEGSQSAAPHHHPFTHHYATERSCNGG
eukprot:353827-Chlamydomonas_euryale.AAC.8